MKVDTWMPLYVADLIGDTMHLSAELFGAYLLLICHYWRQGGALQADDSLATITRLGSSWRKHKATLAAFFDTTSRPGFWVHGRIEREIADALAMREQKAAAGRASAEKRKGQQNVNCRSTDVPTPVATDAPTEGATKRQRRGNPSPSPSPGNPSSGDESPSAKNHSGVELFPLQTPPAVTDGVTPSAAAWEAYREAYLLRYSVEPVRNAMVNGQLANFVKRLGADEAPRVAVFYLTHNAAPYVRSKHAIGLMLQDAEGLRTEWASGRRVTSTQAHQADRTQANGDVFRKLIEEAAHGPQ